MKRKKKAQRPWWRKPRVVRRAALGAATVLLLGLGTAYLVMQGGDEPQFNMRYASHFTLPTTGGEEVTLEQHLGRHNVLLYFNEGMG